jgi:NAD(P)-dependent dehydrogenase (short-subunit alcohol dehydrogenase family)
MSGGMEGKRCIVTGGGSGIGRATCRMLAARDAKVGVLGRTEADIRAVAAEIGGLHVVADMGNEAQIQAALARCADAWGGLDVLVNNAAMMTFTPLLDTDAASFDQLIAVNLRGPFLLMHHGVKLMGRGGAIVNVSSVHAQATTANVLPYAASKGGLEAMTRAASIELAPLGIRANCVRPGAVETPLLRSNPNIASGAEQLTGAVGTPEQLAEAICWLASDAAAFVTGSVLTADGGRLASL